MPRSLTISITGLRLTRLLKRARHSRKPCIGKFRRNSVRSFGSRGNMGQKIRFYTDEHVARAVINGLRLRGVDVLTVAEAGMLSASDEEHLARARNEDRVIF